MEEKRVKQVEIDTIRSIMAQEFEANFKYQLDHKVAEIEVYFQERAAKQEQETQLLKKTLVE